MIGITSFRNGINPNSLTYGMPAGNKSTHVSFAGNSLEKSPASDVFNEEHTDKKKIGTGGKIGIGLGIVGIAALAGYLIVKGKGNKAKSLAEHIDFKSATNMGEALEYGKNNLGIKEYQGFEESDFEIINYINDGLTEFSNLFKGKAEIVDIIKAAEFEKDTADSITKMAMSTDNKTLLINIKFYRTLNQTVGKSIQNLEERDILLKDGTLDKFLCDNLNKEDIDYFESLLSSYRNGKIDLAALEQTEETINMFNGVINDLHDNPINLIERVLKFGDNKKKLEKLGYSTDIEAMRSKDKNKLLTDAMSMLKEVGIPRFRDNKKHATLFHEEMHLLDKDKLNTRAYSSYHYDNDYSKYPDILKEWIDNKEYQDIAKQISDYAASGPNEFIAEYGKTVLRGNKVSEEAAALYKQLEGPELPQL